MYHTSCAVTGRSGSTAGGSGTAHEVFADLLGSVVEVVETATNTVVANNEYNSFGHRTTTGTLTQRYGFTGREHDTESGLIYYRARTYDPAVGMFLQRDPIGFAAGDLNLYAYVENDPYNWTDPTGLTGSNASLQQTAVGVEFARSAGVLNETIAYTALATIIYHMSLASSQFDLTGNNLTVWPEGGGAPGPKCESLREKVRRLMKEIQNRENEILRNPGMLPQFGPGGNWETVQGHRRIVNRLWRTYQKVLDEIERWC